MALHNIYDRKTLQEKLQGEDFHRHTVSFYRYAHLKELAELRNQMFLDLSGLGILGRIYLAAEGINAQVSVPEPNWEQFAAYWEEIEAFRNMSYRFAREDRPGSFLKLKIKVREKLVADGLDDDSFDVTNTGQHLDAKSFNEALEQPETLVVDLRNHYESEVGHFEGAILPDVDTFREELPEVLNLLEGKEEKKVLLYCTGGIRCEKASAFLKHQGFKDVNQLKGGIIDYARQIEDEGLQSKFVGKNFVFDDRLGERITEEVISHCHQCEQVSDDHTNCANNDCHQLFIQCDSCKEKYVGCCSAKCRDYNALSPEEKAPLRHQFSEVLKGRPYRKGRLTEVSNLGNEIA